MTAMSVFNESWNGLSTEKTAQQVVKAVEKVEKTTEKVVDAISKIKITNSNQTDAVSLGLAAIAESAMETAKHLRSHPNEVRKTADTMASIGRQLTGLTTSASEIASTNDSLRQTVGEAQNTADWFKENASRGCNQCVSLNNLFGRVVHSFDSL